MRTDADRQNLQDTPQAIRGCPGRIQDGVLGLVVVGEDAASISSSSLL